MNKTARIFFAPSLAICLLFAFSACARKQAPTQVDSTATGYWTGDSSGHSSGYSDTTPVDWAGSTTSGGRTTGATTGSGSTSGTWTAGNNTGGTPSGDGRQVTWTAGNSTGSTTGSGRSLSDTGNFGDIIPEGGSEADWGLPGEQPLQTAGIQSNRQFAGGQQAGGTQAGGTQAGGTQAGGTQAGGTQAGSSQAGRGQAGSGQQSGSLQASGQPARQLQARSASDGIGNGKYGNFTMVEGVLPSVYFGFDSSSVAASERSKLQQAASYLQQNSDHHLLVEGHCDWYGTSQYNLALGDRRADSISSYLGTLGISPMRIQTLSKGSLEATSGLSKSQSSQDRRADLILLRK